MALKMLCQLLVALCVVGYANAVISGKAVRPSLVFITRELSFYLYILALSRTLCSRVAQVSGRLLLGTVPSAKPYPAFVYSNRSQFPIRQLIIA